MLNNQFIKDFYTIYIHLDKWTFELLEWKIQMFNKTMEKDYYSGTVGLKPIWVVEKFDEEDIINKKYLNYLYKKKNLILLKN